jgi:hypothetical protein
MAAQRNNESAPTEAEAASSPENVPVAETSLPEGITQQPEDGIPEILKDVPVMKGYYKDYTLSAAMQIAKVLPEAYRAWEKETTGHRWSASIIAQSAAMARETVSRYLSAFRKAGVTKVNGTPVPPKYGQSPL